MTSRSLAERARAGLRARLFRTRFVKDLLARWRAVRIERSYSAVVKRYEGVTTPTSTAVLLEQRGARRLDQLRGRVDEPRILFMGTDPRQDQSGLLQGLAAVGEVSVFAQDDDTYGQLTHDGQLSFRLAKPNGRRLLALLDGGRRSGRPYNVVVGQWWSGYSSAEALRAARDEFGVILVNLAMDDRHVFKARVLGRRIGTRGLVDGIDLCATTAPEAVAWYQAEGCPAIWFPLASDPQLFRPMPALGKECDVCFVGARYGIRQRLVEQLHSAGVDVRAYGSGWPAGVAAPSDVPSLFAQARIVLGVGTIGHSETLIGLKLRDFDGPMSGSCYVCHANDDLRDLYEFGREIAVYDDVDCCIRLVGQLLRNDRLREDIGAAGRARASRDHTWSDRFKVLIDVLDGVERP